MFRTDSQGAVLGLPPPEPPGLPAGFFSKGNPALGQKATVLSAEWANMIQEEVAHVVEGAGIALDQQNKADFTQLRQAIVAMIGSLSPVPPPELPIGSIIPFYDGLQALPDLSNRYLVGFGSEGGNDLDSAVFSSAPVGIPFHEIDLSHAHTVNPHVHNIADHSHSIGSHVHTINAHSHTVNAHSHSITSQVVSVLSAGSHSHGGRNSGMTTSPGSDEQSWNYRVKDDNGGWVNRSSGNHIGVDGGGNDEGQHGHTISADGVHNHSTQTHNHGGATGNTSPGTNTVGLTTNGASGSTDTVALATDAASPATDVQLSALQSIQPRSIRVRFLMRIA